MLIEAYIALVGLAIIAIAGIVAWADARYQRARRMQRLAQRSE